MNSIAIPLQRTQMVNAIAVRRAAVYCRISADRKGEEAGVTRQREDGVSLCATRGLVLREDLGTGGVFSDNDISATNGAFRPGYAEILDAAERGEIDVIVVWQMSRFWRNRRERAEGLERLSAARVDIVAVKGQDLDLSNASGRAMAALLGEFDTMESEVKKERMVRAAQQAAELGKPVKGGNRAFGYAEDRITVVDAEADVIRGAAKRVLAGESLRSVCSGLNGEQNFTAKGKPWTTQGLKQVLVSARISGRREYRPTASYKGGRRPIIGEIVGNAQWPGVVSVADSDRLRAMLTNPARRVNTPDARKRMLSGILRCGRCGYGMVSRPREGVSRYLCKRDPGRGGCGRMYVHGPGVDARVRDLVVQLLADSPDFADRLNRPEPDAPDVTTRLRDDEEMLQQLAADLANGEITRAEWKVARQVIVERVESARARLARSTATTALAGFLGPRDAMLRQWNEGMNDSQRRAVVQAVVDHIDVVPPTRAGGPFESDRIRPVWRA